MIRMAMEVQLLIYYQLPRRCVLTSLVTSLLGCNRHAALFPQTIRVLVAKICYLIITKNVFETEFALVTSRH